jgi:Vesicle coat complex COPI, gamma subunit
MIRCIEFFDIREIADKYVTFLFGRISRGINEVRALAMDHLVLFLQDCHVSQITANIIKRIGTEFQSSPTSLNRVRFLEIYKKLTDVFSRNFLRNHKLNDLAIKLASDKTSIVKKKFLEIAFNLRIMLSDEEDGILLVQLREVLNRLCNDKTKDIAKV